MDDHVVQSVYQMLMSQDFVDWYEDKFMDYVSGEEDCATTDDIMQDLKKMLY